MSELTGEALKTIQEVLVKPQIEAITLAVTQTAANGQREVDGVKGTLVRIFDRMDKQEAILNRIDERTKNQEEKAKKLEENQKEIVADVEEKEEKNETKAIEKKRWSWGQVGVAAGLVVMVVFFVVDHLPKG